jgi:hypothetical protein
MGKGGGFRARQASPAEIAAKQKAEELAAQRELERRQSLARKGVIEYKQSAQEKAAGVLPPSLEGYRDLNTGELLGQYKFDPYQGEAVQALKQQAFAQGDSPWAQLQNQKLALEQSGLMDSAAKQQMQAAAQNQAQLAMTGGLSGGARERMARMGARDLMMARQGISRQGAMGRMGIQEQDLARKESLLGTFANAEQRAQEMNLGSLKEDINRKAMFESGRYGEQMKAWAAKQSADAQRAAASKSGGKK